MHFFLHPNLKSRADQFFPLFFFQTQADLTHIPILRPQMRETTALGAAIAAGFAVGVWDGLEKINTAGRREFRAAIPEEEAERRFLRWEKAVRMCRGWLSDD
jgi:glycerol kinase